MGTIVKRGARVRAVVRKGGQTLTKTFDRVGDAKAWISQTEVTVVHRVVYAGGMDMGAIFTKYRKEVLEKRPGHAVTAVCHCRRLAINFDKVDLATMTKEWWIDTARSFDAKPASVTKYMGYFKGALIAAEDLWSVTVNWDAFKKAVSVLRRQGIMAVGRSRTRRVSDEELAALKAVPTHFDTLQKNQRAIPLADIIDFAIGTGMRRAEIVGLKWADLDATKGRPMIWVRDRKDPKNKIGNDDHVPLLGDTLAILQRQPRMPGEARIFPFSATSLTERFITNCQRTGITGLRFHDMRHEAITRLFERGYSIVEVALVSGHKNWETLKKYTHIKPNSLHDGPLSRRAA